MSKDLKGKSGPVRVMYVRPSEAETPRKAQSKSGRVSVQPSGRYTKNAAPPPAVNPWLRQSGPTAAFDQQQASHGGIAGKSQLDDEQVRRQRAEETKVYGENACQALFSHRPEVVVRAWFTAALTPRFRQALKLLAATRRAYHIVEDDEMRRVAGTEHHGGICLLIKRRAAMSVAEWCQLAGDTACILALDGISNPHNIGAILRSCAHFGVKGVFVANPALLDSGAAVRTAVGGAEHIQAITAATFSQGLLELQQAGYRLIATSSHRGVPLTEVAFPAKSVLLLGQEQDGLASEVMSKSDLLVTIAGTGQVESLNVSVASGILLSEWRRQHPAAY